MRSLLLGASGGYACNVSPRLLTLGSTRRSPETLGCFRRLDPTVGGSSSVGSWAGSVTCSVCGTDEPPCVGMNSSAPGLRAVPWFLFIGERDLDLTGEGIAGGISGVGGLLIGERDLALDGELGSLPGGSG